jgi:O-antigen/teichoic acid export membrane protein
MLVPNLIGLKIPDAVPGEIGEGGTGKFIRDVFFSNLPLPFQTLRSYLWLVLFSRAFGPGGYGIWALFLTMLSTAVSAASMAQGYAMMRFLSGSRSREETNRGFSSVLAAVSVSSMIVAAALAGFSRQFSDLLFRDPRGRIVFLITALIVPIDVYFEEMRALLRARRLNRSWAFFTLDREIPATLLLIGVAWRMRDPVATIRCYLVIAACAVLVGFFYLVRCQHVRLTRPSGAMISKYVPYGLALIPGAVASSLSFAADRYLVGYYLGLSQVGIYSLCFSVSSLGFFLVGPLNGVLLPEMAALYDARDRSQFHDRFSGVQKFTTGLAMGATALLVAFPQQILRVLTTRDFSSGGPTLAVLGLQGIFMSIVLVYMVLLLVQIRGWWTTFVWAVMGTLVVLIDVVLLPRVGIVGAGFSQLISSVAGAVLVVGLNWEVFRRTFHFVWGLQTGAALLGVWVLAHFWWSSAFSIGQSLEQITLGAAAFVFGLLVTRFLRVSELVALKKALSRSGARAIRPTAVPGGAQA